MEKTKKISFNTVMKNKTLSDFGKEENVEEEEED